MLFKSLTILLNKFTTRPNSPPNLEREHPPLGERVFSTTFSITSSHCFKLEKKLEFLSCLLTLLNYELPIRSLQTCTRFEMYCNLIISFCCQKPVLSQTVCYRFSIQAIFLQLGYRTQHHLIYLRCKKFYRGLTASKNIVYYG